MKVDDEGLPANYLLIISCSSTLLPARVVHQRLVQLYDHILTKDA
jgi:hypothetical protein